MPSKIDDNRREKWIKGCLAQVRFLDRNKAWRWAPHVTWMAPHVVQFLTFSLIHPASSSWRGGTVVSWAFL